VKRRRLLGAAAGSLLCASAAAAGEVREALVIGNAAYRELPLRNPGNDARAMHDKLGRLGFRSRLELDAGWRRMIEATQDFVAASERADLRLLYYAGHGAQVRGRNYLIPVDAPMASADELIARSLDAGEILERLGRSPRGLNLLILDACRNNPASQYQLLADGRRIKVRGAAPGLARMQPPRGALVAFATAPGSVAADGAGGAHSLYTQHLLRHIGTPRLALEQMFKRVRIDVMNGSAQRQRPWEESSLTEDYCLAGC
jgi:uncharacterized caspase-like protein